MPLVSVIINVLNGAATLPEAVDSVLVQTFSDWELIVWDDCSSDGVDEILARYPDARIRYFRSNFQVPLGQARQRAINLARGEWIAFLDQDDLWLPRKLQRQLSLVSDSSNVALVYGRTVRFYPGGMERDYDQAHEYAYLPEGDTLPGALHELVLYCDEFGHVSSICAHGDRRHSRQYHYHSGLLPVHRHRSPISSCGGTGGRMPLSYAPG